MDVIKLKRTRAQWLWHGRCIFYDTPKTRKITNKTHTHKKNNTTKKQKTAKKIFQINKIYPSDSFRMSFSFIGPDQEKLYVNLIEWHLWTWLKRDDWNLLVIFKGTLWRYYPEFVVCSIQTHRKSLPIPP